MSVISVPRRLSERFQFKGANAPGIAIIGRALGEGGFDGGFEFFAATVREIRCE